MFDKTHLNNYVSNSVEVGFNQYGPSLAIDGTISARDKVVFVHEMTIRLIRKKGHLQRHFDWLAFRPDRYKTEEYKTVDLKMASKFMVSPDNSYPYNIFFVDQDKYGEMKSILQEIKTEWNFASHAPRSNTQDKTSLFEEFIRKPDIAESINRLGAFSYWEEGEYCIEIIITTGQSYQLAETKKYFFLTEEHIQKLKTNTLPIIKDLCTQSEVPYVFVKTELNDVPQKS